MNTHLFIENFLNEDQREKYKDWKHVDENSPIYSMAHSQEWFIFCLLRLSSEVEVGMFSFKRESFPPVSEYPLQTWLHLLL